MYRGRASKWYLACHRSFTGNRCEEESSWSVSMEFRRGNSAFQSTGKQEEMLAFTSGSRAVVFWLELHRNPARREGSLVGFNGIFGDEE